MTDVVPDLRGLVQRFWGPLLAEYRFAEVDHLDRAGEFQMVIYASPDCQIKFIYERGAIAILFGRSDAPRAFPDEANGRRVWYSMSSVRAYENEIHPGQAYRLPPEPDRDETDDEAYLRTTAALMRPYMPRVIAAFSPRPPDGWWLGFYAADARDRASFAHVGTSPTPP